MSPEQAKGRQVDRRTDIFAFGGILYEMLSRRPAFEGADIPEILSGVLQREPDWMLLPANVPPRVWELLRLCLEKNPMKRRQVAGDVRIDIELALAAPSLEAAPRKAPASSRLGVWIVAAVAGLVAAVFAIPAIRHLTETPPPEMRLQISTPPPPVPSPSAQGQEAHSN